MSAQALRHGRRKALALWGGAALLIAAGGTVVVLQCQSADAGPSASGQASSAAKKQAVPATQPYTPSAPVEAARKPAQPGTGNGGGNAPGGGNDGSGPGGGNNGNGGGNTRSGATPPGKALTVTASAPADLQPGQTRDLVVTVNNPNSQAVRLTLVDAKVDRVANPNCSTGWFIVTRSSGGQLVPARGSLAVPLPLTFADADANQDACKSTTYYFSFTANGQQA